MSVTVSELGSARVVTWDRQANRNAWTRETIEAIADGIEAAGADEAVRCVVARGAGEHFSAGDDLFAAIEATPESWAATVGAFQRVTSATLAAPIPVLAAIDGVCIGGALEFAASCDLRIATDRARFGTPEVGIGLTYTNAGSHFLPSTMGETAARELLLTGALRDVAWAERHRFVNEVVPASALRRAHRGVGRGLRRRLARRRRPHQGDAQRPLRRSARRGDGARGARMHRVVRRTGRAGGAASVRQTVGHSCRGRPTCKLHERPPVP